MHHCFGKRNGDRRARATPSGDAAGGRKKLRNPRRVPGRGYTWSGTARRGEDPESFWQAGSGTGRNCGDGAIFGTRREERIITLADWLAGATETGLYDPWRAGGRAVFATSHRAELQMEGGRGAIPRFC